MRIDTTRCSPKAEQIGGAGFTPNSQARVESLEGIGCSMPFLSGTLKNFWRMVENWIRKILSSFFPVNPRCSIPIEEVRFSKGRDLLLNTTFEYTVVLNGKPTQNFVKFEKKGSVVYILSVSILDEELREHLPTLFEKILKEEKVSKFTTQRLTCAKVLVDSGYVTQDSFIYNQKGVEEGNRFIKGILGEANKQKESLSVEARAALDRIEKDQNLMNSFIDLSRSLIMGEGTEVAVSDLLVLISALGYPIQPTIKLGATSAPKLIQFTRVPS